MKILQIISLSAFVIFVLGCEKIPFINSDQDPEFFVEMNIDGIDYLFEAGNDDYFMQSEPLSMGPTIYSGTILRKINDTLITKELALSVSFQSSEAVNNSDDADHFDSFKTGFIPFSTFDSNLLPVKEVVFFGDYTGTGTALDYEWDYGDGGTVNYKSPIHAYESLNDYIATLKVSDDNQCIASATNTVSFDDRGDCVANIEVTSISSTNAVLEATSSGQEPFQYNWFNGTTASDASIEITDQTGVQEYCVTITDANGCQSVNCAGLIKDTSGTVNTCVAEMEESNYTNARTAKQFNSVQIDWVLEGRLQYSSRDLIQPNDSYFEITSFEEYDRNAQGKRTVKVNFEFSATLYLTGGIDPVKVENAKGSIAVGLP